MPRRGVMERWQVFDELQRRGATKATVAYSGGNDEGGPDEIKLYRGEEEIGRIHAHHVHDGQVYVRDEDGVMVYETVPADAEKGIPEHNRPKLRDATDQELKDDELRMGLSQPVYDVWGGFNGEFYTSGVYSWLVDRRQVVDEDGLPVGDGFAFGARFRRWF